MTRYNGCEMNTAELAVVAGTHRVYRSFAFVDLSGFTDFVDTQGDEAAVRELQLLRSAVREVTPRFGVRVEKWLGDGAMLVGVDNQPVVAAVVAIEQRHARHGQLPLRAGIATGAVLLMEGDDYIGQAVNVAARLCDHAAAGEVLAAPEGLHLPAWVQATGERMVTLRGLHAPIPVAVLTATTATAESTESAA